jgi:hypothetical protein
MKTCQTLAIGFVISASSLCSLSEALGDVVVPVTGWVVHNGTGSFAGSSSSTNSPALAVADNQTIMAPFAGFKLQNDQDFVKVTATLALGSRTSNLNANNLNTQLRIGLFQGTNPTIAAGDSGYNGFLTTYSNQLASGSYGNLGEQTNSGQTSPLTNFSVVGTAPSAGTDVGGDTISGANPISADFVLTLTRNGSNLDIHSEVNSAQFNYSQVADFTGYTPQTPGFDFNTFTLNRVGFFFGNNVDGVNGGSLNDVNVTFGNLAAVPESPFGMLFLALVLGGAVAVKQWRSAERSQVLR